jgi:serine/threonine protein kinase
LPEPEVLSWAATLCDALTYLHSQTSPITFHDLKPQNVMLRRDGRVALIDFGIARASQGLTRHVQSVLQPINRLDALIAEARHTNTGLPHVLLVGPAPPGMLLRHIAEAIARDLGVTIRTVNSRDMAHAGDLATILTSVQAGHIVYMDDVNALALAISSMRREAMVEFAVDFGIGKGSLARTLRMTCQRFTLVGGIPSRRAVISEAVSYFAEHIDARSLDSASNQPTPTPRMKRPPESTSSAATCLATTTAWRWGSTRAEVLSYTRGTRWMREASDVVTSLWYPRRGGEVIGRLLLGQGVTT